MMGFSQLRNCFSALEESYEITCLCDNHAENLARSLNWCQEHGKTPKTYGDWRELLKQGDFELAVIVTPDFLHEEMAVACLLAGKHLRLEKPMAITLSGCVNILQAWEKHQPVVQVGYELRYANLIGEMRRQLPGLGRLKMVWCHEFRHPFLEKGGSTPNWIVRKEFSGGTLLEKNCHHFDLFNMLAGAKPITVYASGDNQGIYMDTNVLDNAFVTVEYENGIRAMLSLCMFSPKKNGQPHMNALEIGLLGDKGRMELRDDDLYLWDRTGQNEKHSTYLRSNFEAHTEDILPSLVELARCIHRGTQPYTNLQTGVNSTIVALSAERSAEQKRSVPIAEMEQEFGICYVTEEPPKDTFPTDEEGSSEKI